MVTLAQATFEGGSDGAALSESGWATVGTGGQYDTAQSNQGSVCALFTGSTGALRYTFATPANPWRLRTYVRRGAQAQTTHPFLVELRDQADTYVADFQLRNELGGQYRQRWGFNSFIDQHTVAAPTEQWQRVDLLYRGPDVAVNGWTALVYDPADDTSVEATLEVPTFATTIQSVLVGNPTNSDMDYWLDDVLLSDSLDDPGPAGGGGGGPQGLYVGGSQAQAVYAGASIAQRVYRGSTLIWEAP